MPIEIPTGVVISDVARPKVDIRALVLGSERSSGMPSLAGDAGPARLTGVPYAAFEAPVRDLLAKARFRPARVRGAAVRQLVEQRFRFSLQ